MRNFTVVLTLIVLITVGSLVNCSIEKDIPVEQTLNPAGIYLLLEIMQIARDKNPNWEGWNEQLSGLDRARQQELLDSLSMRNQNDPELNALIDSLLSSNAYQLYYYKFGNVKPDEHKQMLHRLPYGWLPSPAGISETLYDICHNQDSIAGWFETAVDRIDLDKVKRMALAWLPEGNYTLPPTHFIMDGNGDAFATKGEVVFDLYSLVLSDRPQSTRYFGLADISVDQIEAVLAHEYHHVFANPIYNAAYKASDDLSIIWRQKLANRMVSEGIAMHCNPPVGIYRATKEDTAIVAFWFRELNQTLKQLENEEYNEKDFQQWYRDSYYKTARKLLKDYFSRSLTGEALNKKLYLQGDARPTLIYTLGWWMVSHISCNGTDQKAVLELLNDPYSLFARYNAVVSEAPDSLKAPQ